MPLAASPLAGSTASGAGMAGPGPRDATHAAICRICSSVKIGGFAGAWAPWFIRGMRPVLTWKSTAAAPTPMSEGAVPARPSALMPWQVAQFARNRSEPAVRSFAVGAAAACAELGVKAA